LIDLGNQTNELHLLLTELLGTFDEVKAAECNGGLRGHVLQQLEVIFGERPRVLVQALHSADDVA